MVVYTRGWGPGLWNSTELDSNLSSVPTTCMTFGKWLHIYKPPFLHHLKGIIIETNLKNYKDSMKVNIKHLTPCMAHNKDSINKIK